MKKPQFTFTEVDMDLKPIERSRNTCDSNKTYRKMIPYTEKWEKEANALARSWCWNIKPCRDCGHPVMDGYCCGTCGSTNP